MHKKFKNDNEIYLFWKSHEDRIYLYNNVYPNIGSYLKENYKDNIKILDIGLRKYNKYCKYFFNIENVNYDVIDIEKKDFLTEIYYNNFYCKSILDTEFAKKNKNNYNAILSFGVLGFYYFSIENVDIYLKNIHKMLINEGIFVLKLDYLNKYKDDNRKKYWKCENYDEIIKKYFKPINIKNININLEYQNKGYYSFMAYKKILNF